MKHSRWHSAAVALLLVLASSAVAQRARDSFRPRWPTATYPPLAPAQLHARDRRLTPIPQPAEFSPNSSIVRLGGGGLESSGKVRGIAFSPDGKRFATVLDLTSNQGVYVTLWDAQGGFPLGRVRTDTGIDELSFSTDSKTLVIGRWQLDVASGCTHQLTSSFVTAVSANGELIAAYEPFKDVLYVWKTGEADNLWSGSFSDVGRLKTAAFSPDGRQLGLIFDDGTARLVEAATGKRRFDLQPSERNSSSRVVFSPDSKLIALVGGARTTPIFDAETGKLRGRLHGHPAGDAVTHAAFTPNGRRLATAAHGDEKIRLWDIESERLLTAVATSCREITSLAISPDGKRLAAAGECGSKFRIQIWELDGLRELFRPRGPQSRIRRVVFSPDSGQLAVGCDEDKVHLWKLPDKVPPLELTGDSSAELRFSHGGKSLTAYGHRGARTSWGTASGEEKPTRGGEISANVDAPACTAYGDGVVAFGSRTGRIDIVQLTTGKVVRTIDASNGTNVDVGSLAFSPDGKWLAAAPKRFTLRDKVATVRLWDAQTGKPGPDFTFDTPPDTVLVPSEAVDGLEFSPDGDLLTARGGRSGLNIWSVADGKRRFMFYESTKFCFSPGGGYLLGQRGGKLQLLELVTGKVCFEQQLDLGGKYRPTSVVTAMALSPDGRFAACAIWPENDVLLISLTPGGVEWRPTADERARAWLQLLDENPAAAHRAAYVLTAGGDASVELLQAEMPTLLVPVYHGPTLARRIEDLDAEEFEVREQAMDEILALGELALSDLLAALAQPRSNEQRRRLDRLILSIRREATWTDGAPLRRLRAIGVLEQIGTPAAGRLLARLTEEPPYARETFKAKHALSRLNARLGDE